MRKLVLLGLTALVALALGFLVGPGPEAAGGSPGWTQFRDRAHGFTVRFPSSWQRARHRLDPDIVDPGEILSLGTGALKVGGGGNCDVFPAAAMSAMRPTDVLISLKEQRHIWSAKEDRDTGRHLSWFRSLPKRPARFAVNYQPRTTGRIQQAERYGEMNRPGKIRAGNLTSNAAWTELQFRDHGRAFLALVAIGVKAPPQARRAVMRTLDSLKFGSRSEQSDRNGD